MGVFKMKVLLYCTKAKPIIYGYKTLQTNPFIGGEEYTLNGKVVASFELNKCEEIKFSTDYADITLESKKYYINDLLLNESCITYKALEQYGKGKPLYAWHIDNLQIFDEPIELGELYSKNITYIDTYRIRKAPQSYQYVYYKGEKCLLLPIKSQHCYNILHGEKTIEIRKSVPKEVKENV